MNRTRAPPKGMAACRTHPAPAAGLKRERSGALQHHITLRPIMSKSSLSRIIILCAVLAACADKGTNSAVTAPEVGPAFSEASADVGGSTTVDGPLDMFLGSEAPSTQMAAAAQAATGNRASGHVGFNFSTPTIGLQSEQYSFVALSTDPSTPFAAKGSYELMLTSATGVLQKFHGDVVCMNTVGNTTRVAGQITKVWINNVPRPINPAVTHNIWTVVDNGEGQPTVDTASPMIFFPAAGAQFHCATGFTPPQFPVQEGNVQIQP